MKKTDPKILDIDEYQLDVEWKNQPGLYLRYSQELSEAKMEYEIAKSQLELTKAELDGAIREKPEDFGLDKITESAVSNAIILQEEYQDDLLLMQQAKYLVDALQGVVIALDHRKRALQGLVDLHGYNYFAEPRSKAPDMTTRDSVEKKTTRTKGRRRKKES